MNDIKFKNANRDNYSFVNCSNIVIVNAGDVYLRKCTNVITINCKKVSAHQTINLTTKEVAFCQLSHKCSIASISATVAVIKDCDYSSIDFVNIKQLVIHNYVMETAMTIDCNLEILNVFSSIPLYIKHNGTVKKQYISDEVIMTR